MSTESKVWGRGTSLSQESQALKILIHSPKDIHTNKNFYTIWLEYEGTYCPVGKHWERYSTALKWARKIREFHERKGYKVIVEDDTVKTLPEHLAILELKNTIFTYDEIVNREWKSAFKLYYEQGLIVEYSKVLKQRVKVRGVGIVRFKQKYNIPKDVEIYTFVRDKETKEYKELERLWAKRVAWIQMVDRVSCDRVDRLVEDGVRVAERRKTKSIDRQIVEEVEWLKSKPKVPKPKEPFVCGECGGTTFKVNKGQKVCTNCGVGFNLPSAGPGPRAIKRSKRKFRKVEYLDGTTLVLDKEGQLVKPLERNGVMEIHDNDGWVSGKGVM